MNKLTALLLCATSYNLLAQTALLPHTTDWIKDNVFTQGIEGPAVDNKGHLYAVNFKNQGTIGKVIKKDQAQLFITLPKGSIGNGIRFDSHNNMFIADYTGHNILKVDNKTKLVTVFAHNKKMNQPNDIAIMKSGVLFASDPNWSNNTGNLWRIDKDGSTHLLESNMGTTNGIEVSNDQKLLYINESKQRKIWQYDIQKGNTLINKRLLIEFPDFGLDGMRTDIKGNLYVARYGKGVIAKVSPQGKLLKEIQLRGKFPTNIAFGGNNRDQIFITMQKRGAIETIMADYSGAN
ncbi:SMP-30/gluconolactonase/LRE family protein [Pseudoalteromonas denitrificans]|jgi:sugar lactone lactonase YvrE|uniref:Sugar lactone lactonase YvrE n=1 Tax=Pseudoalteromonas denitrificans DSM 6059 TaxID=1123010 RepID=A0A1I1N6K3_9GAMM|nr:SMP-30/gluconolactonase/LRE family protein [Pseudoalteromonas denitrificans]SFC93065.1 Sugar lactone lactonase YvrE [Pseudoalteromonas denitrificans DSM 6059]